MFALLGLLGFGGMLATVLYGGYQYAKFLGKKQGSWPQGKTAKAFKFLGLIFLFSLALFLIAFFMLPAPPDRIAQ